MVATAPGSTRTYPLTLHDDKGANTERAAGSTLTNPAVIVCPADPPEPNSQNPRPMPARMNRICAMVMVVFAVTTDGEALRVVATPWRLRR